MELFSKDLEEKLPKMMEGDGTAYVKFILPETKWKWYACEYDPENQVFYGLIEGNDKIWGKFSLKELEEIKGPNEMNVKRDENFTVKKMK